MAKQIGSMTIVSSITTVAACVANDQFYATIGLLMTACLLVSYVVLSTLEANKKGH